MSENTNTTLEVGKQVFESKDMMLTGDQVMAQIRVVDWVKNEVMKPEVHYGEPYPGAKKKSLWKAGAEKLCITFRIASLPTVEDLSGPDEIRYRVTVIGKHILTGQILGAGLGECSSNEEKYKWRAAVSDEEFEKTSSDRKRIKYAKEGNDNIKQIRTNPADMANTILKMADKRANTAMAIKVTAASDIFDQDLEDMDDANYQRTNKNGDKPKGKPTSSGTEGNFHIRNYTVQNGTKKNGESWTKYTIVTEEGGSFGTFSETVKDEALRIKNSNLIAHIVWKKGQYGNDLVSLAEAKPEPATQQTPQSASSGNGSNPPPPPTNGPQSAPPPSDDSDLPPHLRKGYRG